VIYNTPPVVQAKLHLSVRELYASVHHECLHDHALERMRSRQVDHESARARYQGATDGGREHKPFLNSYQHQCGINSKQQDTMVQHQQQMKSVLYDVVDTFDTYEMTNDAPDSPIYVAIEGIGPAFVAYREALKELTGAA
jgi:hypothetical protein